MNGRGSSRSGCETGTRHPQSREPVPDFFVMQMSSQPDFVLFVSFVVVGSIWVSIVFEADDFTTKLTKSTKRRPNR